MSLTDLLSSRLVALPLRNPNFALYAAGSAVSLIGMWMQRIAIGWLTWQLTGSGLWLGIVAFADFFPVVLIGPVAGAAADRWDRLRVVKISQTISLVQATVLFLLTASGHMTIELLVALTAFQGMVVAFNQPARLALVPSLVPAADLATAVAINSIVFNLARFIGPACAGPAIVWSGVSAAFAANAVSYLAFLLALARIRIPADVSAPSQRRSLLADLTEGIRYTASHPGIAALLVLLIAIGVGGRPLSELLPGIVAEVFGSGAGGLSLLASSMGAGAILGGLWLGHRAHSSDLTQVAIAGSIGAALATVTAIATARMWLAVPAVAVVGFSMSNAGIAIQSAIQLATDGAMRGRVMGLYGLIFRGAPAIGALGAGLASAYFGLRPPVLFGALIVLAACLWVYLGRERIAAALKADDPNPAV
ncbi:MAG TPA: MFS transporter [Xanthobacteraceae bacterium]|jgi:predicted MFS family arabinose efflux permease